MLRCCKRYPVHRIRDVYQLLTGCVLTVAGSSVIGDEDQTESHARELEEIIVTAQKREQSLQETPIAISTLDEDQLEALDIRGLAQLAGGAVPSLRVMTHTLSPSTLTVAIRGNGPSDSVQITRDGSVAFYLDGIYLGRGQGQTSEYADLERIEVLRGPQGTLAGRNATGGAVNLLTKQPTGELGFEQTFTAGQFDEFRSVTRLNLPAVAGVNAKLTFLHSERDGWVNNTAAGESDYHASKSTGGRLSLSGHIRDDLSVDYTFDKSKQENTQVYLQLYQDNLGVIGVEEGRQTQTRFPIAPLDPTVTKQQGHALTLAWQPSDQLTVKSLSSYRSLEEDTRNNYGGVLYANGLMILEDVSQSQMSQEFQLIGASERLEWVTGLYYYKERASEDVTNAFTLDIFGSVTGTPGAPISPPIFTPTLFVTAKAESQAIYGQVVWTPPVLDDRLNIALGLRYTDEEKSGSRRQVTTQTYDVETRSTDPAVTVSYALSDTVNTYAKWSTGHRAGGANYRSTSFSSYGTEEAETFELGLKSEFWDRRCRLNVAVFSTEYDGMQLDLSDPNNITILETINAANAVQVDGVEVDMNLLISGIQFGIHYSYLDGEMPLQPNPLAGGALEQLTLPQAPEHSGAFTADYVFAPTKYGTVNAHIDMTSTSEYAYFPSSPGPFDAYTLWNARLSLTDIPIGDINGRFKLSVWGRNLTDEEYAISSFVVGNPVVTIARAYGPPRSFGLDLSYQF